MDKQADQQRGHIPTVPQQHGFFRRHLVRMVRAVLRRPARLVIGLVVAAACFGFLFNALVLQGGRHPAPLFTQWGRVTEDPLPVPRPVPMPPSDPVAASIKSAPAGEPVREVLFVQRALNRLGFGPIQPDGVMGLATQQAIDRFANARKWGKQDGISRRLIAELSEATGLKPE
jgi:hypothetical protein